MVEQGKIVSPVDIGFSQDGLQSLVELEEGVVLRTKKEEEVRGRHGEQRTEPEEFSRPRSTPLVGFRSSNEDSHLGSTDMGFFGPISIISNQGDR